MRRNNWNLTIQRTTNKQTCNQNLKEKKKHCKSKLVFAVAASCLFHANAHMYITQHTFIPLFSGNGFCSLRENKIDHLPRSILKCGDRRNSVSRELKIKVLTCIYSYTSINMKIYSTFRESNSILFFFSYVPFVPASNERFCLYRIFECMFRDGFSYFNNTG